MRAGQSRHLDRDFADHAFVRHGQGEWRRGPIHTNTIEGYFSIFKRGMKGFLPALCQEASAPLRSGVRIPLQQPRRHGIDDPRRFAAVLEGAKGMRLTDAEPVA